MDQKERQTREGVCDTMVSLTVTTTKKIILHLTYRVVDSFLPVRDHVVVVVVVEFFSRRPVQS